MSTSAALDFETKTLKTLDACILKMSECLDRDFDPADKQSMSLFRQFCSALRSRVQWIKNYFKDNLLSTVKTTNNGAAKTNKSANIEKTQANQQKETPILRCTIEKSHGSETKNNNPKSKNDKINGLLMKR